MAVDFGKYQLLRKIGSGGMGQVFLARAAGAEGFEKLLVVKRLLPHLAEDQQFVSMFFEEARITARLNHPNLVQIFELGEVDGAQYLAMEYVAGEDLRGVERYARAKSRPLPLEAVCRIVADSAAGLDYAHKARDPQGKPLGLVHRDVSPQNILLGFGGAVKLIDFGVAKAAASAYDTASGVLKGKYSYMSPEQSLGEELDPRSDVFALGVIFWELLTGKRLFKGDNELMTMRLVADCLVPPPTRFQAGLPPEVDALVLGALQRNRADRFTDAAAFGMAIEEFARSHRLAASTAHLSAFLHHLYRERIAQEMNGEVLDELQGLWADSEVPPARPAPNRRSHLRGAVWGTAAALVLVFGAAAAIVRARRDPPSSTVPALGGQQTAPARAGAAYVRLTLLTQPTGARVAIDGRAVGETPMFYDVSPTAAPVVAQFSLEGFEPATVPLSSKQGPLVSLVMKKKGRHGEASVGIKTGR